MNTHFWQPHAGARHAVAGTWSPLDVGTDRDALCGAPVRIERYEVGDMAWLWPTCEPCHAAAIELVDEAAREELARLARLGYARMR